MTVVVDLGGKKFAVAAWEYDSLNAARAAWTLNMRRWKTADSTGVSLWTLNSRGRFRLAACGEPDMVAGVRPGPSAREIDPEPDLIASLIERRVAVSLTALIDGGYDGDGRHRQEAHYGNRGAYLRPGGVVEPRRTEG